MLALSTKRGVKMAGFWSSSICVFIDRDKLEVNKTQEKNEAS